MREKTQGEVRSKHHLFVLLTLFTTGESPVLPVANPYRRKSYVIRNEIQ